MYRVGMGAACDGGSENNCTTVFSMLSMLLSSTSTRGMPQVHLVVTGSSVLVDMEGGVKICESTAAGV